MADFAGYEDWSLQAVVRGCCIDHHNNLKTIENDEQERCSLSSSTCNNMPQNDDDHHQQLVFDFSDDLLHQTLKVFDDGYGLEALYKPFFPVNSCESTILSPMSSSSKQVKNEADEEVQEMEITCLDQTNTTGNIYVPKYKKRKNQHKRVVMQLTAEGLSADKWAWRKYGQKPIKGSPYPRSYYRCSSMKGCLARKQVEQSCSDSNMFIVTYTAEHCHSQPTRRNSLAGTVRNKFPITPKSPINNDYILEKIKDFNTSSPSSSEVISPKSSLLMASNDDEISETKVKQENIDEDEFSISDIMIDDDFFAELENLDGSNSELANKT